MDTSLNKPLSPTSSITSQRRLEWDSLADVGYANESDRKNSASSLSTLERLALKQQYTNNDTKQGSNIGLPTAQSTPMDLNEPKTKKASKTTKIFRRDVDHVEVNLPECSNLNSGQSINVNLTKHISFSMEKDGGITVDDMKKNLSIVPENVADKTDVVPQVTDKEIQTSLLKEKKKSSSPVEVSKGGELYGQGVPVLINLNAFRRRNRRKKVTRARKKPIRKKRFEANKENLPFQEKSGEPVSEAESFEYMPGHIYNQNKINRDETRPHQSAGNKSSLESSGAVTTDSSKESKKSFTKDLEKSFKLLKGALQKRYNDSDLKERLIKEVVQRLLKANYRDEDSTTEFLSGLSFNSKKIGLTEDPTTSTSDANNTAEDVKSSRPRKSILRSDKFNTSAVASTSQSAPNLASVPTSETVNSNFAKTLLTSNTESDASSKEKTSSEELYQKYLDAVKKEEAYKKHLRDKEKFLKQKRVCSDATFNFPSRLDVRSQNRIKNLMKDLTRNNYDDGSGDASKLEGGPSSSINVRYPMGIKQRSHSVFTLSSGNSEGQRKAHIRKGEEKELPRKHEPPLAGSSRKEGVHSIHSPNLKFCDSSTQANIKKDKLKHPDAPGRVVEDGVETAMHSKRFPQFLLDPNGEIKYVCVCNDMMEDIPRGPENYKIYKCSRLDSKCIEPQDIQISMEVKQSQHDDVQTFIPASCTHTNRTKIKSTGGKDCGIFSKCSQTNLEYEDDSSKGNRCTEVYWVHEGVRCIQTEISIDPTIPEACLSDIKMINDTDCAQLIYEQYRQKSKSSINTETSKTVTSENSKGLTTVSSGTSARRVGLELYRPPTDCTLYKQGNRQQVEFKDNVHIGDLNNKITVTVGTNADDLIKTPLQTASQAIGTYQVKTKDNVTSLIEECSKGNQSQKTPETNPVQSMPSQNYVVNTLFTREVVKPTDADPIKKTFLRSDSDSNVINRVERRNKLIKNIIGVPKVTGGGQNQYPYLGYYTYPIVEDQHLKLKPLDANSGKFELHYGSDCDRATYHGVIEMKGTSRKCYDCQDSNCQGTCKKNAVFRNNKSNLCSDQGKYNKSNKSTDTDSIIDLNNCQTCKSSTCKGSSGENPMSYCDATCGTSDANALVKRKCDDPEPEISGGLCDTKSKKPKGNLRFACGDNDRRSDALPVSPKKNVRIESCLPKINTAAKEICVCPETADCKGSCDVTAKCLKKELARRGLTSNEPKSAYPESSKCTTSSEVTRRIQKPTVCEESSAVSREPCRIGRATSPIGRATSPIGRATSPIGRGASPSARATSPIGRASSPVGRATSPISRATSPIQRKPRPVATETSPGKSPNSVRRAFNKKKDISSENLQKSKISGSSCNSEGMYKRKCVCSRNAKCGGYCAKTAKCMVSRSKLNQAGKGDHVELDSDKSDKSNQTSSEDKKSSCRCPASSECMGTCGNDAACAVELNTKSNADSFIDTPQEDKIAVLTQSTSNNYSDDSETADSSKNLIKEKIQDLTRRYSKKSIHKSEKKKCFKEIMTLLNYLLDTEEESTDVDIARAIESGVSENVTSKKRPECCTHGDNMKTQNTSESSKYSTRKVDYSDSSSPGAHRSSSPHASGSDSRVRSTGRSTSRRQISTEHSDSHSPHRNGAPTRNTSPALNPCPFRSRYPNSDIEHKSSSEDKKELSERKTSTAQDDVTGGSRKEQHDRDKKSEKEGASYSNRHHYDGSDSERVACACHNNCGDKNCYCEKKKSVKDVGVQLDTRKSYRDRCTESSDVPISTDLPSSDSATCKVLNKIKKECEKYQQRRCKSHHAKRCEISSSTSVSCEQCTRAYHCQWKQHRCKSCKKSDKKKNVGYNLFIQTSDSMISEELPFPNPCRPLMKNIILKVPRNKKTLGEKVPFQEITCNIHKQQQSPRGDGKTRSKSAPNDPTVRDYLEQNRPDFIQQCVTRQKCLKMISEARLVLNSK